MDNASRTEAQLDYRTQNAGIARKIVLKTAEIFPLGEVAGWPLIIAAVVALLWANVPWFDSYERFWAMKVSLDIGTIRTELELKQLVNQLLMPVFFYVVGLEIKHELTRGELSTWKKAAMPACLGIAAMAVPVAVYLGINVVRGGELQGWPIPLVTDHAFAVAILLILGDRVPDGLKALLLSLAAVTDLGGVLAIAFFHAHDFSFTALGVAAALIAVIVVCTFLQFRNVILFALLGLGVFMATYSSGIHTTIAGVLLGLTVSARPAFNRDEFTSRVKSLLGDYQTLLDEQKSLEHKDNKTRQEEEEKEVAEAEEQAILGRLETLAAGTESAVERVMRIVTPWVSYAVLPLFALANTGIELSGDTFALANSSVVAWGIFAALVLGKPLGILLAAYLVGKTGLAKLPTGVDWPALIGMAFLASIGFTVSLLLSELAFSAGPHVSQAKVVIFAAAILSSVIGATILFLRPRGDGETEDFGGASTDE